MIITHPKILLKMASFCQVFDEKSDFFASATATPPKVVPRLQRIATSCRLAPKPICSDWKLLLRRRLRRKKWLSWSTFNRKMPIGAVVFLFVLRTTLLDVGTGTGEARSLRSVWVSSQPLETPLSPRSPAAARCLAAVFPRIWL